MRRSESRALYKFRSVSNFVVLDRLFPASLPDHHSLTYLLRVRQELVKTNDWHCQRMRTTESRISNRVAISSFVDPLDEISGLLEFNREEVGRGDVDALEFNARL